MMSERFSGLNDNINNENALADNTIAEDEIKEKKRKLGLPEGFEFETPTSGGQFGTRHQNPGRNYDEPEEEEKVEDEQWLGNLLKTNSGGIWGALKHDNNNNDDDDDDENFDDNDDLRTPGTSGRQQDWNKTKNRMCDWSLACRYLAGLSMVCYARVVPVRSGDHSCSRLKNDNKRKKLTKIPMILFSPLLMSTDVSREISSSIKADWRIKSFWVER